MGHERWVCVEFLSQGRLCNVVTCDVISPDEGSGDRVGDNLQVRSQQKILSATVRLIETGGFEAVNMAAIAHEAGVSRQTVYSNFGSREEVVSKAMADLTVEALSGINARLLAVNSACEYVVEFIVAARAAVRAHPVLATLLLTERGDPVFSMEMMDRAKPVAHGFLSPIVERNLATSEELDDILEISVRLGLSVIAFDSHSIHGDENLRSFLTRWLQPAMAPPS